MEHTENKKRCRIWCGAGDACKNKTQDELKHPAYVDVGKIVLCPLCTLTICSAKCLQLHIQNHCPATRAQEKDSVEKRVKLGQAWLIPVRLNGPPVGSSITAQMRTQQQQQQLHSSMPALTRTQLHVSQLQLQQGNVGSLQQHQQMHRSLQQQWQPGCTVLNNSMMTQQMQPHQVLLKHPNMGLQRQQQLQEGKVVQIGLSIQQQQQQQLLQILELQGQKQARLRLGAQQQLRAASQQENVEQKMQQDQLRLNEQAHQQAMLALQQPSRQLQEQQEQQGLQQVTGVEDQQQQLQQPQPKQHVRTTTSADLQLIDRHDKGNIALAASERKHVQDLTAALLAYLGVKEKEELLQQLLKLRTETPRLSELYASAYTSCSCCQESIGHNHPAMYIAEPMPEVANMNSEPTALCMSCVLKATLPAATYPQDSLPLTSNKQLNALKGMNTPTLHCRVAAQDIQKLEELVKNMELGPLPGYSQLEQARPCLQEGVVYLDEDSKLALDTEEVVALLAMLQPMELHEGMKRMPGLKNQTYKEREQAAASIVSELAKDRNPKPYFTCTVEDLYREGGAGVVNADQEIHAAEIEAAAKGMPSQTTSIAKGVAEKHCKKLRGEAAAAAAAAAGNKQKEAAFHVLATVLLLKFMAGDYLLLNAIVRMSLLLIGMTGSGTRLHMDIAAALTFAFAWLPVEKAQQQGAMQVYASARNALARWLFVSPGVFTSLSLLRKFLVVVQKLQEWAKCEAKNHVQHWNRQPRSGAVLAAFVAEVDGGVTEAARKVAAEVAKKARNASEVTEVFTKEEKSTMHVIFSTNGWRPSPADMIEVQAVMGDQSVIVLDQCAGEGVDVKVGWMHAVVNLQPCVKVAFEVLRPEDAVGAVVMHRYLRCLFDHLPGDYVSVIISVVNELLDWATVTVNAK